MILKTDHYHSMSLLSLVISCSAVLQCRLDPAGKQQAFFGCFKKWGGGVWTPSSPIKLRLWWLGQTHSEATTCLFTVQQQLETYTILLPTVKLPTEAGSWLQARSVIQARGPGQMFPYKPGAYIRSFKLLWFMHYRTAASARGVNGSKLPPFWATDRESLQARIQL